MVEEEILSGRDRRAKGRAAKKKHSEVDVIKYSMDVLVKTASEMNPVEFELPPEMMIPVIFPGTDKGEMTSLLS